ncbi:MAG: transposase [Clostridia bacterium]|nr:transposase [Clostridia bacterium]
MEYPKRKRTRLKDFDYSKDGYYFVTVCTKERKEILGEIIVGEGLCALPKNKLTPIGECIEESIRFIDKNYNGVKVDKYVIMPNHIHMIIALTGGHGNPPLQNIVGQMKSYVGSKFSGEIFQRSFHDHIIRNEQDYQKIWEYIDTNVAKWEDDCFHNAN